MGERRVGWWFWVQWVVVNALSWIVGGFVLILWSMVDGWSLLQVAGFAFIGLVQWFVMRTQIDQADRWGLSTAAGWAVAAIIAFQVMVMRSDLEINALIFAPLVGLAVAGALVGIMQWLVLRRQTHKANLWILANIVSWTFGWGLHRLLVEGLLWEWPLWEPLTRLTQVPGGEIVLEFLILGLPGALQGAITGVVLIWLLRQPITTADSE